MDEALDCAFVVLRRHSSRSPWFAMNPPHGTFAEAESAVAKAKAYSVTHCEYKIYRIIDELE